MRLTSLSGLALLLLACDDGAPIPPEVELARPLELQRFNLSAAADVTFAAARELADASCFAAADVAEGALALVTGDDGGLHLIAHHAGITTTETIAAAGERHRVTACALSLDAKGRPEAVVAWITADGGEIRHFVRDGASWGSIRVADFAAAQLAFNARSPRGAELVAVAAARGLYASYDGAWLTRSLPIAGVRAVALTVDAAGRSHFALGADYYGDRDGQYVLWRGGADPHGAPEGGLAIVLDPASGYPHILHAERAAAPGDLAVTNLYRTVIGPDSAMTTLWVAGAAVMGYQEHLAPLGGQLAARLDGDGHLHTVASLREDRGPSTRWSARYHHDRDGAVSAAPLDVRATGGVAFAGDDVILASDHGALVIALRTSRFPEVEPAPVLEPPAVGAVDACSAGFSTTQQTVLRSLPGLSAVTLTAGDGALIALEWDLGRGAVRATRGDAGGWTTTQITPWQRDTMSAGRARAALAPNGALHAAWPEGRGLAHWTELAGGWVRTRPPFDRVKGLPDLGSVGDTLYLAARADDDRLSVATFRDGHWSAPVAIPIAADAFALVSGAASLVLAEPSAAGGAELVLVTLDGEAPVMRPLGIRAGAVLGLRAAVSDLGTVVVAALEPMQDGAAGYEIVALSIGARHELRELGRWASDTRPAARALHVGALAQGGAIVAWDAGDALHAARFSDADAAPVRESLGASPGAVLWTGFATPAGRLVLVQQGPTSVDLIGQACAR